MTKKYFVTMKERSENQATLQVFADYDRGFPFACVARPGGKRDGAEFVVWKLDVPEFWEVLELSQNVGPLVATVVDDQVTDLKFAQC